MRGTFHYFYWLLLKLARKEQMHKRPIMFQVSTQNAAKGMIKSTILCQEVFNKMHIEPLPKMQKDLEMLPALVYFTF